MNSQRIPCGKTLGHGESCMEGNMCDQCKRITDMQDIVADLIQIRDGLLKWKKVVDEQLVIHNLGTADSYEGKESQALYDLFDLNIKIATDPRVNGGYELRKIDE